MFRLANPSFTFLDSAFKVHKSCIPCAHFCGDLLNLCQLQVVKGIDAVTREQLARLVVLLGLDRFNPILSTMTLPGLRRPVSLTPTVTQEDEIVLDNVRRIVAFLSSGSRASQSFAQVCSLTPIACNFWVILEAVKNLRVQRI